MFSGIVQEVGIIKETVCENGLLNIFIDSKSLINEINLGDSISVDGCCQTVVEIKDKLFKVQATKETLDKTNFKNFKKDTKINLESSLKLGEKIGGHLVLGHVDCTGKVVNINSQEENKIISILFPAELAGYIARKGSISVNGVSLTVIDSAKDSFTFTLIPYTRDNTNLGLIRVGDTVNLEVDLLSRYLVNYLEKENLKESLKK